MSAKKLGWLLPLVMLAACASGSGNYSAADSSSVPVSAHETTSAAAQPKNEVPEPLADHKIIRTADFQCKVQNVFNATTKLEQLVKSVGGMVQESHMSNTGSYTKTSYYKPDSLKQVQAYTTTCLLTLRVPSRYYDSVVNAIPGLTAFIDSRSLKQNDVTYQYAGNELINRAEGNDNAAALALKLAKKSKDPLEVQQYEDAKKEQQTGRQIENMQLLDNVSYATITVAFSQPEQVYVQTIVNTDYVADASFPVQCIAAIRNGLGIIRVIIVDIVDIWPILLFAVAIWVVYRKTGRRKLLTAQK